MLVLALLSPGCLINQQLYDERYALFVDDDGDGWIEADGDCDDADPSVHPANADPCDGVDGDCDGVVDEDIDWTWYRDADHDGYGDPADALQLCAAPAEWVAVGEDCDDTDPNVYLGAPERCDLVDDDCDGAIDEGFTAYPSYPDLDGDTYGDAAGAVYTCVLPAGYVDRADDCDDTDGSAHPGAGEECGDGVDNDCDGTATGCSWAGPSDTSGAPARLVGTGGDAGAGGRIVTGDIDLDGYDDVFIGSASGTGAWLWRGDTRVLGEQYLAADAATSLTGTSMGESFVFGGSVALCDFDDDGVPDLVTTGYDPGGLSQVFVFDGRLRSTIDAEDVTYSAMLLGDLADATLACRDLDGDGVADIVVGMPGYDDGSAENVGAIEVLYGATESGGMARAEFDAARSEVVGIAASQAVGASIATIDLYADGDPDLLAGLANAGAPDAGLAWLVEGPVPEESTMSGTRTMVCGRAGAGIGVVAAGDLTGDGYDDVALGAPDDSSFGTGTGAVYIVSGEHFLAGEIGAIDLCDEADAIVNGTVSGMGFGSSVLLSPAAGPDPARLVVGAPFDDSGGTDAGAVYLWSGMPLAGRADSDSALASWRGADAGDGVGAALGLDADIDADGLLDLLLGAPGHDGAEDGVGAVHVYYGSGL
ncbi:MAG: MopE-related protein [Pseudomonadota bacterium]|nr:MopE-related protein [Pseudomonadota bacterium]